MQSIPLRYELYARKPIRQLMDTSVLLIVDSDLRLDQVSRFITGGNRDQLHEHFIVTENRAYLGIVRMMDLLRSITQDQLQTERRRARPPHRADQRGRQRHRRQCSEG